MELTGDPEAIAALKALREKSKDYLKFLIQEVESSFEGQVKYKGPDGVEYTLSRDPKTPKKLVAAKAG